MIRPFSLFVGLRYVRAKRRNRFVSFISFVSVLGIGLGVTALITVLSVMNGFDYQIRQQFFSVAPAVTISTSANIGSIWQDLRQDALSVPEVVAAAPFISGKGMLINQGLVSGVETLGVLPEVEPQVSEVPNKMVKGSFDSLVPGAYHMVVGVKLAAQLGLALQDKVNLFTPETTATPFGILPRFRQFTVTGIFNTHSGFGVDTGVAFIHLADAQKLYSENQATGGLHLRLQDVYRAQQVTEQLSNLLPANFYVSNWTESFGTFFKALAMEKTMMFVILLLIVAVAAFNLVSTLMMTVNDKRSDIAILRTIGASPGTIMSIFVIQGGLVGLVGIALGVGFGSLLATYATDIVNWIQHVTHHQFISSSVYFIDFLPSRLQWHDVLQIALWSWVLSLLATLYPAYVASRTQPAQALRYE